MTLISARFSLLDGTSKRKEQMQIVGRSTKMPRAADIAVEQGQRPSQTTRRLPANAPVDVCVYKYTDEASHLWDAFQDKQNVPLYQIQISHQAQRSVTFQMRDAFNDFLRATHAANNAMPATLQQLEQTAGVRLVVSDKTDPDDVGFVQWRIAFYATDVCNFLLLLDGFWKFKERHNDREQPFQVVLHPHEGIDLSGVWEDLGYEHYMLQEANTTLPLGIFEAQPVVGKRITTLNLQVDGDNMVSMIIAGHTWPWRASLDAFGISGGYHHTGETNKENDTRKYYRVWKNIDVSDEGQVQKFITMLDDVFKNVVMRVFLDRRPQTDTSAAAFVDILRRRSALFFDVEPAPGVPIAETQAVMDSCCEDEQTQPRP